LALHAAVIISLNANKHLVLTNITRMSHRRKIALA